MIAEVFIMSGGLGIGFILGGILAGNGCTAALVEASRKREKLCDAIGALTRLIDDTNDLRLINESAEILERYAE